MDTPTDTQATTVVGVLVTRVYDHTLAARLRECGDTFLYETHVAATAEVPLALRVACLCPDGHGVAGLPWRGWLSTRHGKFDLADIPAPDPRVHWETAPVLMEVPEDLAHADLPAWLDVSTAA